MSGAPEVVALRRYQWPSEKTPTPSLPSPFQSPDTNLYPVMPYVSAASAGPAVSLLRRYHETGWMTGGGGGGGPAAPIDGPRRKSTTTHNVPLPSRVAPIPTRL